MRDVEERAEHVLAALPSYVWDGDTLPVPVEDIADTRSGCSSATSRTWAPRPAPRRSRPGRRCRACCSPRAARSGSTPGGRAVAAAAALHDRPRARPLGACTATGQQALFCRATTVEEAKRARVPRHRGGGQRVRRGAADAAVAVRARARPRQRRRGHAVPHVRELDRRHPASNCEPLLMDPVLRTLLLERLDDERARRRGQERHRARGATRPRRRRPAMRRRRCG